MAWKRSPQPSSLPSLKTLTLILIPTTIFILFLLYPFTNHSPTRSRYQETASIHPYDCFTSPQPSPVFASVVESLPHPFLYSLADLGTLPDKPHRNIARMLKGKPFRRPDISLTIQQLLEGRSREAGIIVDVGANVGMATFAAAVMGFRVVAFEPVAENLWRICDGVWLNRVAERVTVFPAVASDRRGNITFHKLVGRLDNSAVSATGAKLAFKSNEEVSVEVPSIPLDEVIPDTERVLLIKIDVQGWEYHVLKGASKLLSRKGDEAPYLIYEEDERLLSASNSSSTEIREFLASVGYHHCKRQGTDAHCSKNFHDEIA